MAYIILRMGSSRFQEAKNSMNKHQSILSNYGGKILGLTEEIEIIDCMKGMWNSALSCMVIEFMSEKEALLWFSSAPDVKQPDWLGGIDVVMVPIRVTASNHPYVLLLDAQILDTNKFFDGYAEQSAEKLRSVGASVGAAATHDVLKLRGLWDPNYLVVHFAPQKESLLELFKSCEYSDIEYERKQSALCDIVLLPLQSLK